MMGDLSTIIGIIFGVGGAGFITVCVAAYRRIKVGKIDDDEALIKRLHARLRTEEEARVIAERNTGAEVAEKWRWREAAMRYRLQLIENRIAPDDPEGIDFK